MNRLMKIMDDSTYWFFEQFIEDNFCLLYDGNFSDDVTDKVIGLSEYNFEHHDDFQRAKRKVSFLMAECFQNIIRHGGKIEENKSDNIDAGFFLTRNIWGRYFIASGNLIKNENVAALTEQLDKINTLDKESLRALHIDILANKGFSEKGGAGLGLIEIARKSGQKIDFVFDDYSDEYSLFYTQINLQANPQINQGRYITDFYITEAMKFHRKMLDHGIFMIQKGDFSHSSILPVLDILERNLPLLLKDSPKKKEIYHVLVEMLQNISIRASFPRNSISNPRNTNALGRSVQRASRHLRRVCHGRRTLQVGRQVVACYSAPWARSQNISYRSRIEPTLLSQLLSFRRPTWTRYSNTLGRRNRNGHAHFPHNGSRGDCPCRRRDCWSRTNGRLQVLNGRIIGFNTKKRRADFDNIACPAKNLPDHSIAWSLEIKYGLVTFHLSELLALDDLLVDLDKQIYQSHLVNSRSH